VDGLGTLIEFEAVLSDKFDDDDGFQKLDVLRKKFGIENDDMLDVSYADLVSGR
jgi:adenylate cyclase class IV